MDNSDLLFVGVAASLSLIIMASATKSAVQKKKLKDSKSKRIWSRLWLQRREQGGGVLHMLNRELLTEDPASYKNFLRMDNNNFEKLLNLVEGDISKKNTFMRDSVSARMRLEITLRFLATGETFRSLMYSTRVHESTISKFIPEVCTSIYVRLAEYLKTPTSTKEWLVIAKQFEHLWQFPHCLGALDGKHIEFRAPISAGSYYFNYKQQHSIVLLGLADANYRFIYVNVGMNGRISDGGVYRESGLYKGMTDKKLNFPSPKPLSDNRPNVPYAVVADDAFPLSLNLLKPYPKRNLSFQQRIFNYRLSRARRVIENTFGILANRFRILLTPINLNPNKVEQITLTCVILHNYLATENWNSYTDIASDNFTNELRGLQRQGGNKVNVESLRIREEFKDYFCSNAGAVEWQNRAVLCNNM